MKILFSILVLGIFAVQANAKDFKTTVTWCNGPVSEGDVENCPSFSSWQGVRLKELKSVNLPMEADDTMIRLEDSSGNIWEQPLETCRSRSSDMRGCTAKIQKQESGKIEIFLSIWDIGRRGKDLGVFIEGEQLSLTPDEGDALMYSLTPQ